MTVITGCVAIYGMDSTFTRRLREARKAAKISQVQLASRCGWDSQSRVSMYERGRREPAHADLQRLAKALEVSVAWLIGESAQLHVAENTADYNAKVILDTSKIRNRRTRRQAEDLIRRLASGEIDRDRFSAMLKLLK